LSRDIGFVSRWRIALKKFYLSALGALALATPASAALVSVSGPLSSAGAAAAIIAAPADVGNDGAGALGMLGFDERQGVTLGAALAVDGGFIASGSVVDSHMIFLNRPDKANIAITHGTTASPVEWTFSGAILGVMSDNGGTLEDASNGILGALSTSYPGAFTNRGFESANPDFYTILSANTLGVGMLVSQPGDWIRVVTATPVPLPAAGWMLFAGLGALGFLSRRRAA